jgi:hypothetical protein
VAIASDQRHATCVISITEVRTVAPYSALKGH